MKTEIIVDVYENYGESFLNKVYEYAEQKNSSYIHMTRPPSVSIRRGCSHWEREMTIALWKLNDTCLARELYYYKADTDHTFGSLMKATFDIAIIDRGVLERLRNNILAADHPVKSLKKDVEDLITIGMINTEFSAKDTIKILNSPGTSYFRRPRYRTNIEQYKELICVGSLQIRSADLVFFRTRL